MTNEETDLVGSARCNLENLAKRIPGLDQHPLYKVVHRQLIWALGETEDDTIENIIQNNRAEHAERSNP